MNRQFAITVLACWLFGLFSRSATDDSANAILEKAIAAHGGRERLERYLNCYSKLKGVMYDPDGGNPTNFTCEYWHQHPNRTKGVLRYTFDGKARTLTRLLNGDEAWQSLDGPMVRMNGAYTKEMQQDSHQMWVEQLYPLLDKDSGLIVAQLEKSIVKGRPAFGIKVSSAGKRDYFLYFDAEKHFLTKTAYQALNNAGVFEDIEDYYIEYKYIDGYLRSMKTARFANGKRCLDNESLEYRPLNEAEKRVFAQP